MNRPVLVPLDGSLLAEHAIPWALAFAEKSAVGVLLVRVHVAPTPIAVEGIVVADPALDRTLRESETEYLAGLTARVRAAAAGVPVDARAVDSDDPLADAIARAAADAGAGLVVMSTHGRGAFGRFWLGSVTDDTLRVSPAPVLVVHPPATPADFAVRPKIPHVLVPLDGSALAEQIVPPAVALARAFAADVTLLVVQEPGKIADGKPIDEVAGRLAGAGLGVRTAVREGAPAAAIRDYAATHPGTAISLATHGRTGLGWLLNGSVADDVVHHATGPVLVFHPQTG